MTAIVALILAGLYTVLKPRHERNEALYAKKAILSAVADHLEFDFKKITDEQVQEVFDNQVSQIVLNRDGGQLEAADVEALGYMGGLAEHVDLAKEVKKDEDERVMPLFVFTKSDGEKYYVLSARGKGLWDEIWGNIAIQSDMNTIAGVAFDHTAETPGLGAEIKDNVAFKKQFIGKKLYDTDGNYKSVKVMKGGIKDADFQVDGISGATITGDGVSDMLSEWLQYYEPYLKTVKG